MQTINPAVKIIREAIGKQKIAGDADVRPLHYVVKDRVDGGTLWYNVLTREMLLIGDDEKDSDETRRRLKEQWFMVPQDFDDAKFCREVRQLNAILGINKGDKSITGYTIFTTTDCNARCYYCFELGQRRRPMTKKVAEDVAHYIISHSDGKKVKIVWFGGEPLYNMPAIDTIATILNESGQEFKSQMISNGYLFSPEVIRKAKEEWNLKWVQITLDGTREIYNRSKAFIYRGVNAYERVLRNIGMLAEAGIDVNIRLNVSSRNGEDLLRLVDELHGRFGKQEHLFIYSHALYEGTEYKKEYASDEKQRIYDQRKEIEGLIREYGYHSASYVSKDIRVNWCQADNDHWVTVTPDGRLGKCEHYSDDHFIGSIYNDERDMDMVARFKQREQLPDSCNSCANYPDCIRLEKCEDRDKCTSVYKDERLNLIHEQMCQTYNAWKEWKKKKD